MTTRTASPAELMSTVNSEPACLTLLVASSETMRTIDWSVASSMPASACLDEGAGLPDRVGPGGEDS